jgi:hypothetical protein
LRTWHHTLFESLFALLLGSIASYVCKSLYAFKMVSRHKAFIFLAHIAQLATYLSEHLHRKNSRIKANHLL